MKPRHKITTYRDFMASRGYLDSSRLSARPLLLPFEFNEEEEREISEAIAREEALMMMEEQNKNGPYDPAAIQLHTPKGYSSSDPIKHPYISNLLPSVNDSHDDKMIKQILDTMFSQVCRWDKQYGWSKMHLKKARQRTDNEKLQLFSQRKLRINQRELVLVEHVERLKKEINKRRTKLENEAEVQCGLLTPWRKSRSRPHRNNKAPKTNVNTNVKKEVINPADISLGGDTFDYKQEKKTEVDALDSSSKTEDSKRDDDDDLKNVPPIKQRRLSESQEEAKNEEMKEVFVPDIDRTALHCICRTQYDETKFYLMCDLCNNWFHGNCVNVTEKRASKMDGWTCGSCLLEEQRSKSEQLLYCMCRTPYDDAKFYVGCDMCEGWYHPECVGITQQEANDMAEYICPSCKSRNNVDNQQGYESSSSESSETSRASSCIQLLRSDYVQLVELLELLLEHRMSTPFRNAVNSDEYPDYTQVIKQPIDLSIISRKVESVEYQYLRQFADDVNLMFENAKRYNPKDHPVFKCAETMQEVFEKKFLEVRDTIRRNQQMNTRFRMNSEGQHTLDGSLDIETDQLVPFDPFLGMMDEYLK